MKTKFLKEIGLSQKQVNLVMAQNGKDIQKYRDELNSLSAKLNGFENVDTLQNSLEQYKKKVELISDLLKL